MIGVLHDSREDVLKHKHSPLTFIEHCLPSRKPFHLHNTFNKHLSTTALSPFISSYISDTGFKPSSRSFSQPSNDYHAPSSMPHAKEGGKSILKKPSYATFPSRFSHSHMDRFNSLPCGPKRVEFKQDVLVIHFDKNEGDHVRSESLSLSLEPRNKKKPYRTFGKKREFRGEIGGEGRMEDRLNGFTPQLRHLESGTMKASSYTDDDLLLFKKPPTCSSIEVTSNPFPPLLDSKEQPKDIFRYVKSCTQPSHKTFSNTLPIANDSNLLTTKTSFTKNNDENVEYLQNMDFKFFEDEFCKLWLRFAVDLGPGVSANDVLVKANLTGNKVRIVGFRLKNRCSVREDFNKRCLLPVEVDPYMVSARMDSEGRLFVEGLVTNNKLL